jgi:hypothetical protein
MISENEFDSWRAQWIAGTPPLPELKRIRKKIKFQQVRFVLENIAAALAFTGGVVFAFFLHRQQSELGTGWAAGVGALMSLVIALRLWMQRGTWRAQSESTRAFVELWGARVAARIRLLRLTSLIVPVWLLFCALLTWFNWNTMSPDFKAHPWQALGLLAGSLLVLPAIFVFRAWFLRRSEAEMNEVKKILDEMTN